MSRRSILLATVLTGLLVAGMVGAQSQQDTPQEAVPVPDPIGDILKQAPPAETPPSPIVVTPPVDSVDGTPSVVVPGTTPEVVVAETETEAAIAVVEATPVVPTKAEAVVLPPPDRRQRRPVAIVHAIDKITAESMRFEVEVGGRPVRFARSLIFTARACEVSAADELIEDSIAYLEVSVTPRGVTRNAGPRQIFKGWMFASSPAVSRIEHPIYDAWVVGCKA